MDPNEILSALRGDPADALLLGILGLVAVAICAMLVRSLFRRKPKAAPRSGPAPTAADTRFSIGGLRIPRAIEPLGLLFSGAPGMGKSVAITTVLDTLVARGDGGLIGDRSGIYLSRYYSEARGDIILNPLDARAAAWSPLAEFEDEWSSENIARSLIPMGDLKAEEWNAPARLLLSTILAHCHERDLKNRDITWLALGATVEELAPVVACTESAGLIQPGAEKFFASVRATLTTFLAPLNRLPADAGRDAFSIRKWVAEDRGAWVFWPYQSDQMIPMRTLIAAMSDVYMEAVVCLPPSRTRRRWLVLDEFASVGKISNMENFLTNARKHGGASLLGMQSMSQVEMLYGRDACKAMLSSISTNLILRCNDEDTAEALSRKLGEKKISRFVSSSSNNSSTSAGGGSSGSSSSTSEQITVEREAFYWEIMRLPVLEGWLTLADAGIQRVRLPFPPDRPQAAEPYIKAAPRLRVKTVPPAVAVQAPTPDPRLPQVDMSAINLADTQQPRQGEPPNAGDGADPLAGLDDFMSSQDSAAAALHAMPPDARAEVIAGAQEVVAAAEADALAESLRRQIAAADAITSAITGET